MPYPLGHGASWPAKASWQAIPEGSSPVSFTGEVKQQQAPAPPIPAIQSCCPCPCFPDRGIWSGGVTVSTPDSESGNRGSIPGRAFAETRFVKEGIQGMLLFMADDANSKAGSQQPA